MLTNESLWFREMAAILNEKYGPMGYTIPQTEAAYCILKFFSLFSSEAKAAAKMWGREFTADNSRSRQELGIEYRPVKDSIYDMVDALIRLGHFNPPNN